MIGQTVSHYRITAKLGEGGMGVVYRAHDTSPLDREVAIKVLPEEFARNPDRLTRFEREAKAVAALSHPNVLEIFDFGQEGDVTYAVTELLQGETLREHLEGGVFGWRRAAELGAAIAAGLAAAHEADIVHRDLKPSNVFLTDDGRVKIIDFGLARHEAVVDGAADPQAPTLALPTDPGTMLGTVGYMAPEQVRGDPADARADIFALGCVLHEMVSGDRAFCCDTAVETMNAILNEESAELSRPGLDLPPELGNTIRRCLEKKPEARFQSASDLAYNLQSISSASAPAIPRERPPRAVRTRRALWVSLAVVAAALIAAWIWAPWQDAPAPVLETVPNRVAVAPLENRTGDPSHDNLGVMAAESIIRRFAETGAAETVALSWGPEGRSGTPGVSPDDFLIDQAKQKGAALLLTGACYHDGETFRLQARLIATTSGDPVYTFEAETVDPGSAVAGMGVLSEKIVAAVAAHLHPMLDITVMRPPSSYAAYQAYQHVREFWGVDDAVAISHIHRALALDPEFHAVRLMVPAFYYNLDDNRSAREAVTDAERFLDRFTPFERAFFRARRALAAGDHVAELTEYRQMAKLAPHMQRVRQGWGDVALAANRPREAIEAVTPILTNWAPDYLPNAWWPFLVVTDARHLLGEPELEIKHVDLGLERFPDVGHLYRCKATAMAAAGRIEAVKEVVDDCLQGPIRVYNPGQVMSSAAVELSYHGHPEASVELATQAVTWFERQAAETAGDTLNPADLSSYSCALRVAGRWKEARTPLIEAAESGWRRIDVEGALGVIAAHLGERDEANRISKQLPLTNNFYAAAFRLYWQACITAHLGDKGRAVSLLREAFNKGLPAHIWLEDDHGAFYWRLHADLNLEPLWHYPPYEELIEPKG